MDAMRDAIRSKRQSGMGLLMEEPAEAATPQQEGGGMQALIASLSPEQKQELFTLLQSEMPSEQAETPTTEVEKGAPTSQERAEIEQRMGQADEPSTETDEAMVQEIGQRRGGLFQKAAAAAKDRLKAKGKK